MLDYLEEDLLNSLPKPFIEYVKTNMDHSYQSNINFDIPLSKQKLEKETRILISLIYRKFWCDKEKRKELIKEDVKKMLNSKKEE